MPHPTRNRLFNCLFVLLVGLGAAACTEQDTVPLDLDGTVPLVEPPAHSDSGNEEAQAEGQRLARQQCLEDPSLEEGVVQIVQPETDFVVAEIVVNCSEVR
jgi:hypothetical protein